MTLAEVKPLEPELLKKIDGYWRAASYQSVGQIYLLDAQSVYPAIRSGHARD